MHHVITTISSLEEAGYEYKPEEEGYVGYDCVSDDFGMCFRVVKCVEGVHGEYGEEDGVVCMLIDSSVFESMDMSFDVICAFEITE